MKLQSISLVISKLIKLDSDMPLGQVQVLLSIAEAGEAGTTLTVLGEEFNISKVTCSRYLSALGKINRYHEEGYGYVDAKEDPLERRRKILTLINNLMEEPHSP